MVWCRALLRGPGKSGKWSATGFWPPFFFNFSSFVERSCVQELVNYEIMTLAGLCSLDVLMGVSGLAKPLEHTFFAVIRRKMQAYAVKVRIDDPRLAPRPATPYRAENNGFR